mgnify:CR=1 FL=1
MTRAARDEFPKSVKVAAFERAKGRCECRCGKKILGTPIYDHYPIPASLGGPGTLENWVLDQKCDRPITNKDISDLAKGQRIYENRIGARTKRSKMPGSRNSRWKKKVNGQVVER